MKAMKYKDYTAQIEYSDEDKCFIGHIAGISDIIGFHGDNVDALRKAFEEAVDDYLDCCRDMGKEPLKPFSGKIMLRVAPEIHARATMLAKAHGLSLNQWAAQRLVTE